MRPILSAILSLTLLLSCARKDTNDPLFLLPIENPATPTQQLAIIASETIGPEGGELRTDDGLVVTFPSGALTEPVAIHVAAEAPQNAALPKGDSVSTIYRLTPAMRFEKEITVAVPLDIAKMNRRGLSKHRVQARTFSTTSEVARACQNQKNHTEQTNKQTSPLPCLIPSS